MELFCLLTVYLVMLIYYERQREKSLSVGNDVKLLKMQVIIQKLCPPSHFPKLWGLCWANSGPWASSLTPLL